MNRPLTWEESVLWLRSQPDQAALVRDCFYDDPLLSAAERFFGGTEWQATKEFLPNPGRALDIGAGRGMASYALAREGWQVVALEPDPSNVVGAGAIETLVRETGLPIQVVRQTGEHLPFGAGTFDLVYCRQALHHAADLRRFCSEMGRVLKIDGRLIATREHVISRRSDLKVFLEKHPVHHLYGGESAYLLREYKTALRDAGIQLERVLNPLSSAINFFPLDVNRQKEAIAKRLRIPSRLVSDPVLRILGEFLNEPGRLYSFIGKKA
jgi:SAM-dependent methyltransferase